MNANFKLKELLKGSTIENPSHFNTGNVYDIKLKAKPESEAEANNYKVLTDEDLGLKPVKKASTKTTIEENGKA